MLNSKQDITKLIKAEAKRLGFSFCGIALAENLSEEEDKLKNWLSKQQHAEMQYMENNLDKRLNPTLLVNGALSVISVALNYFPGETEHKKGDARISKYALGRDYHKVIKKMLKQLFAFIQNIDNNLEGRIFVDSAPVMDKAWAEKSGLGWRGKNGNIINKEIGSFFFIGEIICNLDLEYDQAVNSFCGTCTKCIDACPTHAIVKDYIVDAKKCISYQTIENKDFIPIDIINNISDYIFGCDICQDVCPWNNKAVITEISDFATRKDLLSINYQDYKNMSEEIFDKTFNGTPIKRAGYKKIQQTVKQINDSQN